MSWREQDDADEAIGAGMNLRGAWRRLMHQGDNPLLWSLPLMRVRGILVRVGLLFILFALVQMTGPVMEGRWSFTLLGIVSLFVLVLLHEFGHCAACRLVRGQADEILMWPLGGLASCHPPHNWRAHFITTAGGPLVNAVLVPVLALGVLGCGGEFRHVAFNPLFPGVTANAYFSLMSGTTGVVYLKLAVWWLHYTNVVLLLFNVLVPMFPMDGGRLLQAVLWSRVGFRRSMEISVNIGLAVAIVLGLVAMGLKDLTLMGVAIFGGVTCWHERRLVRAAGEVAGDESWLGRERDEEDEEDRAEQRRRQEAAKRLAGEQREQQELDRVLAKISASGRGSLTRKEQAFLEQMTAKKRQRG